MGGKKKLRHNIRSKLEDKKRQEVRRSNDTNPFELKRNKVKHQILGRKIAKNEIGKPLLNRSRAYQKRSQTLLEEYRNKHKGGKGLQDMRDVSAEQRVTSKYKESQNEINFSKSEQIQLTHKGKPLEDFIDDRLSSDDEDIDLFNREDFVETAHFGGGVDGAPRSSRDILRDIMHEKQEKKLEKEETIQLTDKLDSQWSELKSLLKHKGSNNSTGPVVVDDYDNLLSQLMFEGKKSVEETKSKSPVTPKPTEIADITQSPDAIFKAKLKLIDASSDIMLVVKLLKETLSLLPTITRKSFDLLKDRLQKLTVSSLKFTPKEMSIMIISVYFKELQVVTHLMILKSLNKLKYQNYHEVAVSLFLVNFLLKTINNQLFYPELFIHVHNLIRLCQPLEKVKLSLPTRLDYEAKCLLNVNNIANSDVSYSPRFTVTPFSLFDRVFVSKETSNLISYSLTVQIMKTSISLFEKYSQMPIIGRLMSPLKNDLQTLTQSQISTELHSLFEQFQQKFTEKAPSVIVNKILPKPIILPMLEPKFDERGGKKSKDDDDSRKLTRKYRRELKGAQREIRKDTIFLRNTYLKDAEKKDRTRRQKVKEILRDISVQQGLYKKKK